jgi:hypothetical protein
MQCDTTSGFVTEDNFTVLQYAQILVQLMWKLPVSIAERSETRTVFGRSNVEIEVSNPARAMDLCLRFPVLCCHV